ncbi:hypothetical protein C483_14265 [Natrialba hulunbeirensis JCM 10989]|uniref:Uncharacterized protein n=1 Tax=Natrialba hulunbeirensis JCM 10989 TaxID=1227493 RepID=L9ZU75_9EURY|nr:hypothetical protein [Natrialba hulunbeirensis]ELY89122.1 hypothetical protein C483_14265 [Natrialba hulunbeirensis JCM 10989]
MTAHTPSGHGRDQNRDDDESSGYGHGTDGAMTPDAGSRPGTLPLVGGGILVLSAVRALLRGQLRSIPIGAAGVGLLRYGLSKRQESGTGTQTDLGSFADEDSADEMSGASSPIEFVTDDAEPRSKPSLDGENGDPRQTETEDDGIEIDVSESATMSEASEATGPDPTQAEPAQTEGTEPEATPSEELSDDHEGEAGEGDEGEIGADYGTDEESDAASESESEGRGEGESENGSESQDDDEDESGESNP